jgi:hypothetical protein
MLRIVVRSSNNLNNLLLLIFTESVLTYVTKNQVLRLFIQINLKLLACLISQLLSGLILDDLKVAYYWNSIVLDLLSLDFLSLLLLHGFILQRGHTADIGGLVKLRLQI